MVACWTTSSWNSLSHSNFSLIDEINTDEALWGSLLIREKFIPFGEIWGKKPPCTIVELQSNSTSGNDSTIATFRIRLFDILISWTCEASVWCYYDVYCKVFEWLWIGIYGLSETDSLGGGFFTFLALLYGFKWAPGAFLLLEPSRTLKILYGPSHFTSNFPPFRCFCLVSFRRTRAPIL